MVPTDAKLLKQARYLRKRSTDAENYLWYYLRAHRLKGYKFKRQVPIGNYIVDFVCIQRKLTVGFKCRVLSLGYKVLRFWNDDVLLRTGDVLESIVGCLEES
ncbi:TPA: endonuclease domain-containing protein [Legionella pneumophila]|nr:DUF559 domain-containing protein [Legionella pneumophila]HAU1321077.1 endonuclease domain-containing protein [Legionella pneumophila]HBD9374724.1 endonuclease domain-containing protein [Legionella pneumophila]HBI2946706.1 endonuclease domain-containing protein [Legionella pneumophila]HDV6633517.1 endonuclease domain-containing protein [Legionella pneumophila]